MLTRVLVSQLRITRGTVAAIGTPSLQTRLLCTPPPPPPPPPISKPHVSDWNIANYLTATRLALSPVVGVLLCTSQNGAALCVLSLCGVTDALDGYVARRYGLQTALGAGLDPLADKVLVFCSATALWYVDSLPTSLVALVVARDAVLVAGASILPRDKWVAPTLLSKANTAVQLTLCVAAVAAGSDLMLVSPEVVNGLAVATATTTALSGLQYATRFARVLL